MIDIHSQSDMPLVLPTTIERLWLVPCQQTADLRAIALPQGRTEIGSTASCDICLPISGIDAQHCSIDIDGTRAVVSAHSRMTWINDGPVRNTTIKPGQRLAVGPIEFRLELRTEQVIPSMPVAAPSVESTTAVENRISQALSTLQMGVDALQATSLPAHETIKIDRQPTPLADDRPQSLPIAPAVRELERRRLLIEDLHASLNEQASDQLQSFRDRTKNQRRDREEVSRLLNELSIERASLQTEKNALTTRQSDMERRLTRFEEEAQELSIRRSELEQASLGVEEQRRDQYEREQLLQARIKDHNACDAAFIDREAETQRQITQLEDAQASLESKAASLEVEREEWARTREELESTLKTLRESLDEREQELNQLRVACEDAHQQLHQDESDLAERESALTNRQQQLDNHDELLQTRTSELNVQEQSLNEQSQTLQQRCEELDAVATDQEHQRHSTQEESQHLEKSRYELEAARQTISDEHEQLAADRQTLADEQLQLQTEQEQLAESWHSFAIAEQELTGLQASFDEDLATRLESQQELQERQQSQDEQDAEFQVKEQRLAAEQAQLETERSQLTEQRQSLEDAQATLNTERDALEQERADLQAIQNNLQNQGESKEEHILSLQAEEQQLSEEQNRLEIEREQLTEERRQFETAQDALDILRQSLEQDRTSLWESQQERLRDDERLPDVQAEEQRLAELSNDIKRRNQELDAREELLNQRAEQPNSVPSEGEFPSDDSDREALAVERQVIEADREEIETAQTEIQRQIAILEEARDELLAERDRLETDIKDFQRDRQSVATEQSVSTEDRIDPGADLGDQTMTSEGETPSDSSSTSEPSDEYEVTEVADDGSDEEIDDEVFDEDTQADSTDELTSGLRSHLAELFGMSTPVVTGDAEDIGSAHDSAEAEPTLPSESSESEWDSSQPEQAEPAIDADSLANEDNLSRSPAPQNEQENSNAKTDNADSISTYMQDLLARSQQGDGSASVWQPDPQEKPESPAHNTSNASSSIATTDLDLNALTDPGETDQDPSQQSAERKRVDANTERVNIDALRQVANISARSALAIHDSASLRNRFFIKGIVTCALFISTVVLLTAHIWVGVSYVSWGFLAAAAMCVSTLEFLKTFSQIEASKVYDQSEENRSDDMFLSFLQKLAGVSERLSLSRNTPSTETDMETDDLVTNEITTETSEVAQMDTSDSQAAEQGINVGASAVDPESLVQELAQADQYSDGSSEEFVPTSIDSLMDDVQPAR